jgi:16S rRNA processing protein RimM
MSDAIPQDLVQVGYIAGAYGIHGWVRIKPHSPDADALLGVKSWWLDKPQLREVARLQAKMHSGDVVAQLDGVADRDLAEALKGATVSIPRSRFPVLKNGEFYWSDLTGMRAVTPAGESLGTVAGLMDNGAHQILRIDPAQPDAEERLIPFVDKYVVEVKVAERLIVCDWGLDY